VDRQAVQVSEEPYLTSAVIESPGLTVRLDCSPGAIGLGGQALKLWRAALSDLASARSEINGGSVTGFVIEQGAEELNDHFPGGWVK
jgi:hypothetical protein